MTLGAGCWAPGIGWDAENSAAFVGPRAGGWPYGSSCPITAKNGLLIDQSTGKIYTTPPMGMSPYSTHNAGTDTGSNLTPSPYVIQPGASTYTPQVSGVGPGNIVLPAASCRPSGILEYDQFTVDVTVGTGASISLSGLATGGGVWEWTNTQQPQPAQGRDVINNYRLDCSNAGSYGWTDEPWAAGSGGVPGYPAAGLMLGGFQISNQSSGYITVDSGMPFDTTWSQGFTASFWFKPIAWADKSPIFSLFNAPNASLIELQTSTVIANSFHLFFQNTSVNPTGSALYNTGSVTHDGPGTWNFIALVYNPTTANLALYVNQSTPSYTMLVPYSPLWRATGFSLGANYSYYNGPAAAYSNVRTWQRQLTNTEIATLLNTPTASGPSIGTAWFPLNDGVNRQRLVRTFTGVWAPQWTNRSTQQTSVNVSLSASGSNASLINAWTGSLNGLAYSPTLLSYTGA